MRKGEANRGRRRFSPVTGESSRSCTRIIGRSRTTMSDRRSDQQQLDNQQRGRGPSPAVANQLRELLRVCASTRCRIAILQRDLALEPCPLGTHADEDVLEGESRPLAREISRTPSALQRYRDDPAPPSAGRMTCSRSPNSDTRQRSIVVFSRSIAALGSRRAARANGRAGGS